MRLIFAARAWEDYLTGKPEPLKGDLSGWWSRRITSEHRLVYRVSGAGSAQALEVAQVRYHY